MTSLENQSIMLAENFQAVFAFLKTGWRAGEGFGTGAISAPTIGSYELPKVLEV